MLYYRSVCMLQLNSYDISWSVDLIVLMTMATMNSGNVSLAVVALLTR